VNVFCISNALKRYNVNVFDNTTAPAASPSSSFHFFRARYCRRVLPPNFIIVLQYLIHLFRYGWSAVDTVQELAARQPQLYPSSASSKATPDCSQRAHSELPYAAIVLLEMPANWGESIQILVDVLRGNGRIGLDCAQSIPFHCGNPDFDYKDVHSMPRMTLGAFRSALDALYTRATGRALVYTLHGKPFSATYDLALSTLTRQLRPGTALSAIVCVGDNPASDVQGANDMGGVFKSALVKTGVWQGEEAASANQVPFRIYDDVLQCVADVLASPP
jgi:ribonucleotide monophosphatase NagD (HAD superfamily)